MKCKTFRISNFIVQLLLFSIIFGNVPTFAQQGSKQVSGVVTDENNQPMIGVSVIVPGTTIGVATDLDGKYTLNVPAGQTQVRFVFLGYLTKNVDVTQSTTINLQMELEAQKIGDVVVIGYGTTRKKDLTGSVSTVGSKDFNDGMISSPEQLINGKVAGVQIMTNGGSPSAGSSIRIRGGASLNASNDPLIVLDGVPLEIGGISGNSSNFLSLINPNDIESMTVLKDASSTAIYGSRASNGVLLITTKKGATNRGIRVNFTSTNSLQTRTQLADMLSIDEFINVVKTQGSAAQQALLGSERTNWNDKLYKTAFGTDDNISISGRITKKFPYRASFGYYNQDGVLRTDNVERYTGNISLSPSFLDDYLKFNLNVKGSLNNNQFANTDAIWGGLTMNPTIPIYSGASTFGGYTEAVDGSGVPVTGAVSNPVGQLNQYKSTSDVRRIVGNFDVDYKMHFLPELKFHATLGYDYAKGKGKIYIPAEAYSDYSTHGRDYEYGPQEISNKLLTTYLNYNKVFGKSTIDATLGYDFQKWKNTSSAYSEYNTLGDVVTSTAASDQRHVLLSYYGRINYSYDSRYMITATVRRDGTSRFSKDNRWGTFPSVALAWRISNEKFYKDKPIAKVLNDLKIRASYGVTGQQEGIGNYGYLPVYTHSQDGAQYPFGNNYYYTYRPEAYDANLKWEQTRSYNFGFDFGLFDNRITGSVDYYTRKTKDLLATVPAAAGTNFDKTILTNVGNVTGKGFEFSINATPIKTEDLTWDVSYNATWTQTRIENLTLVKGAGTTNTLVGPSIDSYHFQVFTEGYAPYAFYLYHQVYDDNGKPLEGVYADLNNDGQINSSDLYHYHSPAPDWIMGFSTNLRYKKWNLGMSFRANIGNYVYNGMGMNTGAFGTMSYNSYQLNNLSTSYLKTGFKSRQHLSDYYVENASFLKMDNITLGYNFGAITKWCKNFNLSAMVSNVFTVTKYSGVDPEVPNGMDSAFYPRPRVYSLSLGFEF